MVDQAEVTSADGRTELPPRAVARGSAEFLHDFTTLAELQGKLFLLDLSEGLSRLRTAAVALVLGVVIVLGCIPVALMTLALVLNATTSLNEATCFGIALATGLVLALLLLIPAYFGLRNWTSFLDRSYAEWRRNLQWFKDTLKRFGSHPQSPPPTHRWN